MKNRTLLTKNSKMKKTENNHVMVYNFTLPAYSAQDGTLVCVGAKHCIKNCFARKGAYLWKTVKEKHNWNLEQTRNPVLFAEQMNREISTKKKTAKRKGKQLVVRIHDAGDFYSVKYLETWLSIIEKHSDVLFYCYTKSIRFFTRLQGKPENFVVNYSFGGSMDALINTEEDKHVHIFATEEELVTAGYTRNDEDDSLAFNPSIKKVGLVARWGMEPTNNRQTTNTGTSCAA